MTEISRKERDKQLRKADILRAAEHVFASKGYHETTIQDIAKEAQYGTGTVYLYFKDKSALYFSLLSEKIMSLLNIMEEKTGRMEDAREKFVSFVYESLVFFNQNKSFFRLYSSEKNSVQAMMNKKASEELPAFRHITEYLVRLVRKAQEQSIIKKEIDPAEIAEIIIAIMSAVNTIWIKKGMVEIDVESNVNFIVNTILNGIGEK